MIMKYILILFLFLPSVVNSQQDVQILNDSFLIMGSDRLNDLNQGIENLKKEVEILSQHALVCDTITKKAISKEIWYNQELSKWSKMDSVLRQQLLFSNDVINAYKVINLNDKELLKRETKKLNQEIRKKNFYKYFYPSLIGLVTTLYILK